MIATTPGQFTITVTYPGDESFSSSQATATEVLLVVGPLAEIPTLGELGVMLLVLLLGAAALRRIRLSP